MSFVWIFMLVFNFTIIQAINYSTLIQMPLNSKKEKHFNYDSII